MILVMCANTGIDRTYDVENFAVGVHHTPRHFRADAGGKGVNVARGLRALGEDPLLVGFAGGLSRKFITDRLAAEGIVSELVPIGEESRLCINIVDRANKRQTQLDEMPPLVTPEEVSRLKRQWSRLLERATIAVVSGSAPRGVPFSFYKELIQIARGHRVPVVLDARDQLLAAAIEARPEVIKPNHTELEALIGEPLSVPGGVLAATKELVAQGIRIVIASLGNSGAIIATARQGCYWARPPQVDFVSSVGAGDALVAGFTAASIRRESLERRIRWGIASAAAVVSTFGAAVEQKQGVEQHLAGVQIELLEPPAGNGAIPDQTQ